MDNKVFLLVSIIFFNHYHIYSHELHTIALSCGTDKSSHFHNYTAIYETYFDKMRDLPVKFLEIGFCKGASAHTWDLYFVHPASQLYFIDIDSKSHEFTSGLSARCQLDMVDQESQNALRAYIEKVGGDFDIIIDDGGHTMVQQIVSFLMLFPHIKSGGVYIIENLHTSYLKEYGGEQKRNLSGAYKKTTINFLKDLIDDMNYIGQKTWCADHKKCPEELWKTLSYMQKAIASIHFYDSLAFIFKV